MKLIDPWHPLPHQFGYKFCQWFNDKVNFCHGYYFDTLIEKPANPVYNFFYDYWLFPFRQNDCLCCNTVRGLIYGFILGLLF